VNVSITDCRRPINNLSADTAAWLKNYDVSHRSGTSLYKQLVARSDVEHAAGGSALIESGHAEQAATSPENTRSQNCFVTIFSAPNEAAAVSQAQGTALKGFEAYVVQGTNGFFGVSIGRYDSCTYASSALNALKARGDVPSNAFVMPPDRVVNSYPVYR
jgi:hypothetical protein